MNKRESVRLTLWISLAVLAVAVATLVLLTAEDLGFKVATVISATLGFSLAVARIILLRRTPD